MTTNEQAAAKIENRDVLIGLLSTTSGYSDRHPIDAEEILDVLAFGGLAVVRAKDLPAGIENLAPGPIEPARQAMKE